MSEMSNRLRRDASQILKDARWLISEVGWTQGELVTRGSDGRAVGYCLAGAVVAAAPARPGEKGWNPARDEALRMLKATIDAITGGPVFSSVFGFNDVPGRTAVEVLDVLDRAIGG